MKLCLSIASLIALIFLIFQGSLRAFAGVGDLNCTPKGALQNTLDEVRGLERTPRSAHVTQRVPGLYQSIPLTQEFTVDGYHFRTSVDRVPNGSATLETDILDSQGRVVGHFASQYYAPAHQMELKEAGLRLEPGSPAPAFVRVPGVIDLVPGRGVPTQMMVRLQHLRLAGIQEGGSALSRLETGGVSNQTTLAELLEISEIRTWLRTHTAQAGLNQGAELSQLQALIERNFGQTQTGRYIRDMLTQGGFCIGSSGFKIGSRFVIEAPNLRAVSRFQDPEVYGVIEGLIAEGIRRIPALGFSISVDVTQCAR